MLLLRPLLDWRRWWGRRRLLLGDFLAVVEVSMHHVLWTATLLGGGPLSSPEPCALHGDGLNTHRARGVS